MIFLRMAIMRRGVFSLSLVGLLLAGAAQAQDIPRIKARIISFDGKVMTVTSGTAGQSLTIGLMPTTRVMTEDKAAVLAIKPGEYLGATLARSGGKWQAQEIHVMPESLRGVGEGFYPFPVIAGQMIATGAVARNEAETGVMALAYHGSVGEDGPTCNGRAPRQAGCKGEIAFTIAPTAQIVAIKPGAKSDLAPGKIIAVSVIAGPDGHLMTPGLTIENETGGDVVDRPLSTSKPAAPAKPAAKPSP